MTINTIDRKTIVREIKHALVERGYPCKNIIIQLSENGEQCDVYMSGDYFGTYDPQTHTFVD